MAYVINKYNGEQLIVLEDGTLNTTTSLGLLGRNYTGYGEVQNENFLYLLENFANETPPLRPVTGQTWYDTNTGTLNVYTGAAWSPTSSATVSTTEPTEVIGAATTDLTLGALWYKDDTKQLYVSDGTVWNLIGPQNLQDYQTTRPESRVLSDINGVNHPVVILFVNNNPIAIVSNDTFTLNTSESVSGYTVINRGITVSSLYNFSGDIIGNAQTASSLQNPPRINGITFSGASNITVKASTTNKLKRGDYLLGSDFDGSSELTWSVDASSSNSIGKIVARNSAGDFSAGTITASIIGNVTGNVTSTGTSRFNRIEASEFVGATLTGNAFSATKLATARSINGVAFDGTSNITVTASANTLTGTALPSNVLDSSLRSLGRLTELTTGDVGVKIGSSNEFRIYLDSGNGSAPTLKTELADSSFNITVSDPSALTTSPNLGFLSSPMAAGFGGDSTPTFTKTRGGSVNLGLPSLRFNKVFGTQFYGSTIEVGTITSPVGPGTITASGDLIVTGNLDVRGNVTRIDSTVVSVADLTLTLASGSVNSSQANGAGIFVEGASASFTYATTGDKWVSNKDIDVGSNYFRGIATSAQYADLAENYLADNAYEPGTVLIFGGEQEVTTTTKYLDSRVAGIVSSNPAYLMNSSLQGNNVVSLALAGRVPCRVIGKVKKGDLISTSEVAGLGKVAENPMIGTVLGKALEDKDTDGEGVIEVVAGIR